MSKKLISNNICNPIKPIKAESKASRILEVLLTGGKINRKTIGDIVIGANNDSVNSLISILRNNRYIPIESKRQPDGTADYFMKPEEIARYKDPPIRAQQLEEMKILVEEKRLKKVNALIAKIKDVN